jgi:hypothetical protein
MVNFIFWTAAGLAVCTLAGIVEWFVNLFLW